VPASYGGFETCVEEIGKRLVTRGHDVTVYCRRSYYKEESDFYCGMKRICLPNIKHRSLDTMSHTFTSAWDALFRNFDVIMVFNAANSLFITPLRLVGKKIAVNTDGRRVVEPPRGNAAAGPPSVLGDLSSPDSLGQRHFSMSQQPEA